MNNRVFWSVTLLIITVDLLVFLIISTFIPHNPRFVYTSNAHLNILNNLANFDGVHYARIINDGYTGSDYPFFPLYPVILKFVKNIFMGNIPVAGAAVSIVSFIAGLVFFKKLLLNLGIRKEDMGWILILLFAFPTSFFFYSVYTESLFFFFAVSFYYSLFKNQLDLSFLTGVLAGLTRFIGAFLGTPIFIQVLLKSILNPKSFKYKQLFNLPVLFSPFLGLLIYGLYLKETTGDFLKFYHSVSIFGEQRSTNLVVLPQVLYRYLKIFLTSAHNYQYLIAILEFVIFIFFFLVIVIQIINLIKKRDKNSERLMILGLFSLINLLLPTLSGSFSSIPRYALLSLSVFIFLGSVKNKTIKISLLIFFILLRTILFSLFSRGYFVS